MNELMVCTYRGDAEDWRQLQQEARELSAKLNQTISAGELLRRIIRAHLQSRSSTEQKG